MFRCTRCDGFVPKDNAECPNCRSGKKAWWMAPLAFAGAGLATVTLSACYGAVCTSTITLPDGGTKTEEGVGACAPFDCRTGPDGGEPVKDAEWKMHCE